MSGRLFVVGTPIGNLNDLSPRGLQALEEADFIAAEDTRVTLKLLTHFGLKKSLVSYHDHNLRQKGEEILARLSQGESCAIVTDAGMPCISDPGEDLVRLCRQAGIPVSVVPGPSAAISALAISGLATSRFSFEGFLSVKKNSRREHLLSLQQDPRTLIFYEAPHKLVETLKDLYAYLGDREIALCRELTKIHEEVIRTTLSQAQQLYLNQSPRGEFVLVVAGASVQEDEEALTLPQAVELVLQRVQQGQPLSQSAKEVASITGFKKGELYKAVLERSGDSQP